MEKSEFELRYEEFSQRTDLRVEIDGVSYYRVFDKTVITVGDKRIFIVRVDSGLKSQIGKVFIDENDHRFIFESVEMIRLGGKIPDWYRNTEGYVVKPIDTEDMGDYLSVGKPK